MENTNKPTKISHEDLMALIADSKKSIGINASSSKKGDSYLSTAYLESYKGDFKKARKNWREKVLRPFAYRYNETKDNAVLTAFANIAKECLKDIKVIASSSILEDDTILKNFEKAYLKTISK